MIPRRGLPAWAGIAATLLVAGGACVPAARALQALNVARQEHHAVAVAAARSALSAPPAPSAADIETLTSRLEREAGRRGVQIMTSPAMPVDGAGAVRVQVSGPEQAVLEFINRVERAGPPVRFANWRIEAADTADLLRFDAVATVRTVTPL